MKVCDLTKLLEALPQDGVIVCQVVDDEGRAWGMFFDLQPAVGSDRLVQLRVHHPELKRLPDLPNTEVSRAHDTPNRTGSPRRRAPQQLLQPKSDTARSGAKNGASWPRLWPCL